MKTVSQLFKDLGGNAFVSRATGIKPTAISQMAKRDSIPVSHWPILVGLCKRKKITGVNYSSLVEHHAGPPVVVFFVRN